MISVIVDARTSEAGLPVLLAALTMGAVDGLVRDVTILARSSTALLDALCEETGAEVADNFGLAVAGARYPRVLFLPAGMRLPNNWIATLADHLARGGGDAVLDGDGGRWLRPAAGGVLTERSRLTQSDLKAARRGLRKAVRLR